MERIALLIDQLGKGDNIFEKFAIEFENSQMEGNWNYSLQKLQKKVELIERKLQDISERITAINEHEENIYTVTINKTKVLLSFWLPIFSNRNLTQDSSSFFNKELDKLLVYLDIENIEKKNTETISNDFDQLFTIKSVEIKKIENEISSIGNMIKVATLDKVDETSKDIINHLFKFVKLRMENLNFPNILNNDNDFGESFELIKLKIAKLKIEIQNDKPIAEDENAIYTADLKLWINTNDAAEANRFASVVTNVLGKIENIKLTIVDSGIGSYWQKIKIKIQGWFAKEETKQVLKKSKVALESYVLERHIEPIEKSKSDRKKTEEELKRMFPIDNISELHKIHLEKEKEQLISLKLDNLQKKIAINSKLSEMLASGLFSIDSDYRIELNNLLLIKQENGKLEFGNFDEIDSSLKKELPASEKDEEQNNS